MKTISDADWEIIKSAAQVAIDGTLSRSKHKQWSDAMARVETHKPLDVPGAWHQGIASLRSSTGASAAADARAKLGAGGDYDLLSQPVISGLELMQAPQSVRDAVMKSPDWVSPPNQDAFVNVQHSRNKHLNPKTGCRVGSLDDAIVRTLEGFL